MKWTKLNKSFQIRAKKLKESYYQNIVEDLKSSNISQWYSKLKHMSSVDATNDEYIQVNELRDLPSSEQAELIADRFAEISNQYKSEVSNINITK